MIKLIKSSFHNEAQTKKELIAFIKNTEQLSMSAECRKFEKNFAKKQKRKHAVFVNSGSSANLLLIQSLLNLKIIKKGQKIGVSTLTWATNIMPIIQHGLIPVPIDCELATLNISPAKLKEKINGIDVLFITNVLGFCDKLDEIKEICEKKKILLLEDNCESLGSKLDHRLLGNFGIASTFSTFVGHHISTIEGGMVCTDDEKLHSMLLLVRAHGWSRNLDNKSKKNLRSENKVTPWFDKYTFYDLAYNLRPTEITGKIGNIQINYWDEIVSKRFNNFKKFYSKAKLNDDFLDMDVSHMSVVSNFAMPLICKNNKVFKKCKDLFDKNNIEIRPIIAGDITKQPFFKKHVKYIGDNKNSSFIHKNGFYFPNNPELSKKDINRIIEII